MFPVAYLGFHFGGGSKFFWKSGGICMHGAKRHAARGIPGNMATIFVLLSSVKLRRKPINIFMVRFDGDNIKQYHYIPHCIVHFLYSFHNVVVFQVHQGVIDLGACLVTIFEEILRDVFPTFSGPFICQVFQTKISSIFMMYASTWNLTCLTIERHLAIVNPLEYDAEKVLSRLKWVFLFVWVLSGIGAIYIPVTTVIVDGACLLAYKLYGKWTWDYYPIHSMLFALFVPAAIMIACYTRMIIALHKSSKNIRSSKNTDSKGHKIDKMRMAQLNIFQTCFIMMLFFLLCWLTKDSAVLMYAIGVRPNIANDHYLVGRLLIVVNSCINPYIYAVRYDDFKDQMRYLLGFKKKPQQTKTSISTVA